MPFKCIKGIKSGLQTVQPVSKWPRKILREGSNERNIIMIIIIFCQRLIIPLPTSTIYSKISYSFIEAWKFHLQLSFSCAVWTSTTCVWIRSSSCLSSVIFICFWLTITHQPFLMSRHAAFLWCWSLKPVLKEGKVWVVLSFLCDSEHFFLRFYCIGKTDHSGNLPIEKKDKQKILKNLLDERRNQFNIEKSLLCRLHYEWDCLFINFNHQLH